MPTNLATTTLLTKLSSSESPAHINFTDVSKLSSATEPTTHISSEFNLTNSSLPTDSVSESSSTTVSNASRSTFPNNVASSQGSTAKSVSLVDRSTSSIPTNNSSSLLINSTHTDMSITTNLTSTSSVVSHTTEITINITADTPVHLHHTNATLKSALSPAFNDSLQVENATHKAIDDVSFRAAGDSFSSLKKHESNVVESNGVPDDSPKSAAIFSPSEPDLHCDEDKKQLFQISLNHSLVSANCKIMCISLLACNEMYVVVFPSQRF